MDRDGVINTRLPDAYVYNPEQFEFMPGVPDAIARLRTLFDPIVVVTNQQGIGKELMTSAQLDEVHQYMLRELEKAKAHIDKIYYCPDLKNSGSGFRKPESGMAIQAKADFPQINFEQSIIVGDSWSDMEFGQRLGMYCVFISTKAGENLELESRGIHIHAEFPSLPAFTDSLFRIK